MPSLPATPPAALTPRQQAAVTILAALLSRSNKGELVGPARVQLVDAAIDITDLLLRRLEGSAK
jgi:hypothetical protein